MRLFRLSVLLLVFGCLTGCSLNIEMPDITSNLMPTASEQRTISDTVFKIIQEMNASGPVEISEVGPNEAQSGPEKWTVCTRSDFSGGLRYYTFFVRGSAVISQRASVINDRCEARSFSPLSQRR